MLSYASLQLFVHCGVSFEFPFFSGEGKEIDYTGVYSPLI